MTKKRIKQIADFLYSSSSIDDVPCRISITVGQFWGYDLDKKGLIRLLDILNKSDNLKEDLLLFVNQSDNLI